jgi:hypothetical protein
MSSAKTGEWMLVLCCVPGEVPEPSGVLLLDTASDRLAVRIKSLALEDEILSEAWNGLEHELNEQARDRGGNEVLRWLETTFAHVVRVSVRECVDIDVGLQDTLDDLYCKYVERPNHFVSSA